jgi:hypothetical protein
MDDSLQSRSASAMHAAAKRRVRLRELSILGLAAAAVVGLHVLAADHFLPIKAVLSGAILQGGDFDTHIGQTHRVLEGLNGWGQSWVYDVKLLAGQPEGVIFDADNKGWELWTYALSRLGASDAQAFNSFVLLAMLACPFTLFAAARLFGIGGAGSVLAAAMASTIWFFDSFCHWAWWIGMVAYAFVSYFALLPLALFYRFTESGSLRIAACCALANSLAHLIHPYSFFILAPPMLVMYLRARTRLPRLVHAGVAMIIVATLAVNLYWLLPAFAHWHYILDSAFYGRTGPLYLLADAFGILIDPDDSGVIGTRAGFRLLYVGLALACFAVWRTRGDRRLLPLATALATLLVLGYLGGYIPGALQIQPYRHVLPLGFCATLPAAAFCELLWRERPFGKLALPARGLLAVAALLVVQQLAGQALYFLPKLIPEPDRMIHGDPSPVSKYGFLSFDPERSHLHYGLPPERWVEGGVDEVVAWVTANVPPGARVLVETMSLGERIAWKTEVEVIGGFRERNIEHAYANLFRRHGRDAVDEAELAHYLRTFNIGWIIAQTKRDDFERAGVLERLAPIGGFNLYRTRFHVSPFLQGSGHLRARTNVIQARHTDPTQDVVLSYHWHEALRCVPRCRIEREPIKYDKVGLIRVRAPHAADFIIYNHYRSPRRW